MLDALKSWILGLAGAGILAAVAMTITPESRVKRVVSLVCGLTVIVMLIKPVVGFDYTTYSRSIASLRSEAAEYSKSFDNANEKLTGAIIEEACSAYILDKGAQLGLRDLKVAVSAKLSADGEWYPASVRLSADAGKELRDKLGYIVQSELGIPPEGLIWSTDHDG